MRLAIEVPLGSWSGPWRGVGAMFKKTVAKRLVSSATRQKGDASGSKQNGVSARKSPLARRGRSMTQGHRKSVEELAAEQGGKPTRLQNIRGKGADLWNSDLELERFVTDIYARRKEDREISKQ